MATDLAFADTIPESAVSKEKARRWRNPFSYLTLVPIIWITGITVFAYHLASYVAFRSAVKRGAKIHILAVIPLLYSFVYFTSLILSSGAADLTRIIGGFYNLSYWIMGFFIAVAASEADWRATRRLLSKAAFIILVSLGVCGGIALLFWHLLGAKVLIIPTPFSYAIGPLADFDLIKDSAVARILSTDYIGEDANARLSAFAPYPTATAALAAILIPFSWTRERVSRIFPVRSAVVAMGIFALYLSFSRTVIVAALLSWAFAYVVYKRRVVIYLLVGMAILVVVFPAVIDLFNQIVSLRSGSTSLRSVLYVTETDEVLRLSPLWGMGVKTFYPGFSIPAGSHSTILGALYKTGILGLGIMVFMVVANTLFWLKSMVRARGDERRFLAVIGACLVTIHIFMLTEDIDAPQLLCFLYFGLVGLMISVSRSILVSVGEGLYPRSS